MLLQYLVHPFQCVWPNRKSIQNHCMCQYVKTYFMYVQCYYYYSHILYKVVATNFSWIDYIQFRRHDTKRKRYCRQLFAYLIWMSTSGYTHSFAGPSFNIARCSLSQINKQTNKQKIKNKKTKTTTNKETKTVTQKNKTNKQEQNNNNYMQYQKRTNTLQWLSRNYDVITEPAVSKICIFKYQFKSIWALWRIFFFVCFCFCFFSFLL